MHFLHHILSPKALLRRKDCVVDTVFTDKVNVLDSVSISCSSPVWEPGTVGGHESRRDPTKTCPQRRPRSSKRRDKSSTNCLKNSRVVPDDHLDSSHEDYFRNVFKAKTLLPEELESEGLATVEYISSTNENADDGIDSSPWDAYFQRALAELDNLEREDEVVDSLAPAITLNSSVSSNGTGQASPGDNSLGVGSDDLDGEESDPESDEEVIEIGSFSRFGALLPPFPRKDGESCTKNAHVREEGELQESEDSESEQESDGDESSTLSDFDCSPIHVSNSVNRELTTGSSPSACGTAPATPSDVRLGGDQVESGDEVNSDNEDLKKDRDDGLLFDNGPLSRFGSLPPPTLRDGTRLDINSSDDHSNSVSEEVTLSRKVELPQQLAAVNPDDEDAEEVTLSRKVELPQRFAAVNPDDKDAEVVGGDGGIFNETSDDEAYVPSEEDDPGASRQRNCKRKQETDIEEAASVPEPRVTKKRKRPVKENGETKEKVSNKAFNVDFLLERFRFASVHDADKTWKCPFPPSTSPQQACQSEFKLMALWTHVSNHVAELRRAHKNQSVPCPWSSECAWRSPNSRPVEKIGLSDSLVRHILDHHLGARKVCCPCSSIVGRPHLDQVIRHLEAPSHDCKIKKLKGEGCVSADYPAFDRARTLAEQADWTARRVDAPAEGQAGPSRVSKRIRVD